MEFRCLRLFVTRGGRHVGYRYCPSFHRFVVERVAISYARDDWALGSKARHVVAAGVNPWLRVPYDHKAPAERHEFDSPGSLSSLDLKLKKAAENSAAYFVF